MRPPALVVLSLVFITVAAAQVATVSATPGDIAKLLEGFSRNTTLCTTFRELSCGTESVPGSCREVGVCRRQDIGSGITNVLTDAVQQGLVERDDVNSLLQSIYDQAYMISLLELLGNNRGPTGKPMNRRQAYMNGLHELLALGSSLDQDIDVLHGM